MEEWAKHNTDLLQKLFLLHEQLNKTTSKEDIETLGALIGQAIGHFVNERPEVFENFEIKPNTKFMSHQSNTMKQLKDYKKSLQRQMMTDYTSETRKKFWEALRAISDLRKHEKKKHDMKTTAHQEDLFNTNRWEFSKSVTRGEFGKGKKGPTFSKDQANQHYAQYSVPTNKDFNKTNWCPFVKTEPENDNFAPFNSDPIKPRDIFDFLKSLNLKSSPGPDGLSYGILFNL